MIVMHYITVAIFVVVIMMVIVVDHVCAVTAVDRCDAIFVVAAFVSPRAGSAERQESAQACRQY
jgi:hypothetical protein